MNLDSEKNKTLPITLEQLQTIYVSGGIKNIKIVAKEHHYIVVGETTNGMSLSVYGIKSKCPRKFASLDRVVNNLVKLGIQQDLKLDISLRNI